RLSRGRPHPSAGAHARAARHGIPRRCFRVGAFTMNRRGLHDVIVVGAGAVGGALALALARDGFDVAVVEAREPRAWRAEDDVDLRVVALAPDARALLDDIGAWGAIADARIGPYRRMHVCDALAPGRLDF